jgi:hypothetical protein
LSSSRRIRSSTGTRHLDVTREELARVVEKVGNSAAAVREELGAVKKIAVITPATTKC